MRIRSRRGTRQAGVITATLYPVDIRDSGQKDLERNMQTNRKTTANEATRMSGRISEIRDINVIKLIPRRHRLLYLLDVISWLLEAVQFLIVPATHSTRVRESDPWREQPPMRRRRRRKKSTSTIQSSSRYFQPQHPPAVNTGELRPITSAARHQQKGERQERVPVRAGSQWEGLFESGNGGRRREQVGSLTNLLDSCTRKPRCVSGIILVLYNEC